MTCIDLTYPYRGRARATDIQRREVPLKSNSTAYTGVVYQFSCDSMQGCYLDLPGHILETDDGRRADTVDRADFYRMEAAVIHLDRGRHPGGVTAAELEKAWGGVPHTPAVIINALGTLGPFDIPPRSVWLELDAVAWLKKTGCRLLVSDVYESRALEGVFLKLFEAGISAVCEPDNLSQLTAPVVRLTVLFPKMPVTQVPCAMVAEF